MSFFWFSDKIIRIYLRAKFKNHHITEHDFGDGNYKKLYKISQCLSNNVEDSFIMRGLLHDISNHVKHPFNVTTKTAYQFRHEPRTFGEICLNTADKISNITDRVIAVSWSGGIDSTAALVALMRTVPFEQLMVVCNQASIDEFPSFYECKIKDRLKVISPDLYAQHYRDFFSVTGDGGDTVWGGIDDIFWESSSSKLNRPWKDCIDQNLVLDIDFVQEFCSWSGREINSWLDLRIWFYLCCKFQDRCMRPFYLRRGVSAQDAASFYDIDDSFQCWTMNNLDNIIGKRWIDYKVPAKDFIFQYHADVDYLQFKSKEKSRYLDPDLMNKSNLQNYHRLAVRQDFSDYTLPSWPFIDFAEIEDFNDECHLIPGQYL